MSITRIVRLSFDPIHIETFLDIFRESYPYISTYDGCTQLSLMRDQDLSNVFYTYSKWESDDHLQSYRNSDLFLTTWAKTKILFNERPQAFSLLAYTE